MRLKVGDILYVRKEGTIHSDIPFEVIQVRSKTRFDGDDIAIKWVDGHNWWWGQIGETEPWTLMFMSESEYNRNKKINELIKL
jgi:hypothetical protein